MSLKLNNEDFILKSKEVHGDKYDYSLTKYNKSSEKVMIICKEHGIFEQRASNHLMGRGCYLCKSTKMYNSQKFIELSNKIHKNKYDYKKIIYNGSHSKVIITCKIHGDFNQLPTNHLSGKGCSKCATEDSRINNFFDIVNIVHNNKYKYYNDYVNMRSKITINCKIHGDFKQRAKNHLIGQGCPICGDLFGIKEKKWLDYLGVTERQVRIGKYIVDGFDPLTNTIYEFNGDFWHGNPDVFNPNDINNVLKKSFGELYEKTINKEMKLKEKGYNIISIWENDFNKTISNKKI